MDNFFGSSQPMDLDSVLSGFIHESASDSESEDNLANAADMAPWHRATTMTQ